jgi:integrase
VSSARALERFLTALHPQRQREHRLDVELGKAPGDREERRIADLRRQIGCASTERDDAVASQWRLFFALLAHTGVRIAEALGLRWEHVHLGDDPHLDVREQVYRGKRKHRPKSHHGIRELPLSPGMAVALDRHRRSSEYAGPAIPCLRR